MELIEKLMQQIVDPRSHAGIKELFKTYRQSPVHTTVHGLKELMDVFSNPKSVSPENAACRGLILGILIAGVSAGDNGDHIINSWIKNNAAFSINPTQEMN